MRTAAGLLRHRTLVLAVLFSMLWSTNGSGQHVVLTNFRDFESKQVVWPLEGLGYCTAYKTSNNFFDLHIVVWDYDLNVVGEYTIPYSDGKGCSVKSCVFNGVSAFIEMCDNGILQLTPGKEGYILKGMPFTTYGTCAVDEGCVIFQYPVTQQNRYSVEFVKVDDSVNLVWSGQLSTPSSEGLIKAEQVSGQLALLTTRYPSIFKVKNYATHLHVISSETGETYFSSMLGEELRREISSFLATSDGTVYVTGQHFYPGSKQEPAGPFFLQLDSKGEPVFDRSFTWEEMRSSLTDQQASFDGTTAFQIHAAWTKGDGNTVLILESFSPPLKRVVLRSYVVSITDLILAEITPEGDVQRTAVLNKSLSTGSIISNILPSDAPELSIESGFGFIAVHSTSDSVLTFSYIDKGKAPHVGMVQVDANLNVNVTTHPVRFLGDTKVQPGLGRSCLLYVHDDKGSKLELWIEKW